MIDDFADQILTINTDDAEGSGYSVGNGVMSGINTSITSGSQVVEFNGNLEGIITGISTASTTTQVSVKVLRRVSAGGTVENVSYQMGQRGAAFKDGDELTPLNSAGSATTASPLSVDAYADWYTSQKVGGEGSTLYWSEIAPKPVTNNYVALRGGLTILCT